MKGCVSCLEMKSIYQDVRKVGHSLNIQLQRGLDLRAWRAGQSFTDLYLVTPLYMVASVHFNISVAVKTRKKTIMT